MIAEYLDFEIEILPQRDQIHPIIVRSPAGEASGEFQAPNDAVFRQLTTRLAQLDTDEATLRQVGVTLFRALFRDLIREQFAAALNALNENQGLRIQLRIDPNAAPVVTLPWEFLCDLDGRPLALRSMPIVRYLPQPQRQPALQTKLPLRVLLTAAQTTPRIDVEQELTRVQAALAALGSRVRLTVDPHLTAAGLQRALRQGVHIWHFVGHGELSMDGQQGRLRFEDEVGDPRPISAAELGVLLDRSGVRLIVLNACESGRVAVDPFRSIAPALVRAQVPAVIAQQFPASTEATRSFSAEFYGALASGMPLDACVTEGRKAIMLSSGLARPDWGVPIVYTRARDAQLFELGATAQPAPQAFAPGAPAPVRTGDGRVINLWIENLAPGTALTLGQNYTLICDTGLPRADSWANAFLGELFSGIPEEQSDATVEVQLDAADVTFSGAAEGTLVVPRDIGPAGSARMTFTPKRIGTANLKANLFANSQMLGQVEFAFEVQEPRAGAPRAPNGAAVSVERVLLITGNDDGFALTLHDGDQTIEATLAMTDREVADLALRARQTLTAVTAMRDAAGTEVFTILETPVPDEQLRAALRQLAEVGYFIFQNLFHGFGRSAAARLLGERLRLLSATERITIRATDEEFCFPWELLYCRDPLDLEAIDGEAFWGYRHRIERLPQFLAAAAARPQPTARDRLHLALIDNPRLDAEFATDIIDRQRTTLATMPGIRSILRSGRAGLTTALGAGGDVDLLYFFCRLGREQFSLSDGALTLEELAADLAPDTPLLERAPLVVLNESLSGSETPLLADGPVTLLARRGVRGVVGALTSPPLNLAATFGQTFVRRFARGNASAGDILDELRLEWLRDQRNPLGLAFTMYGSRAIIASRSRRDVRLVITRAHERFHATLYEGETTLQAMLSINRDTLEPSLKATWTTLRDITYIQEPTDRSYIYQQTATPIPPDIHQATLRRLAEQGYLLYQLLFYGAEATAEARALGDRLRLLSQQHQLLLTIEGLRFRFPWALLYDAELLDLDHVDPERFWGFRHVIAQAPLPITPDPVINAQTGLRIGAMFDQTLDATLAQRQLDALRRLTRTQLSEIASLDELLALLRESDSAPDLLYLLCDSAPDYLRLGETRLTIDTLAVQAPLHRPPLTTAPFVVLNGANSAAWDPELPRSIMLHILARGARAILATAADVPLPFADEFCRSFVARLAAGGGTAGELLLNMRREYLLRKNNVLGLLYVLAGHPETFIQRK